MTAHEAIGVTSDATRSPRLFFLEVSNGEILSMNPDGSDKQVIVTGCRVPDGIAVDAEAGHIYWTNMGVPSRNDGSIERVDLDGSNRTTIVPPGATFTPKQLQLDTRNGRLFWCDREGMRVMSANIDGSDIRTLVETGHDDKDRADQTNWCVGIAIDHVWNEVYWTQKGPDNGDVGRLFRASLELKSGETPDARTDIQLILDRLPEPIDLEIANGFLYWTDRGDPPRGNSLNRMKLEADEHDPGPPEIISTHLMEGIGLAIDLAHDRLFTTDLAGSIYCSRVDGAERRPIAAAQGNLTGIAYALVPTPSSEK